MTGAWKGANRRPDDSRPAAAARMPARLAQASDAALSAHVRICPPTARCRARRPATASMGPVSRVLTPGGRAPWGETRPAHRAPPPRPRQGGEIVTRLADRLRLWIHQLRYLTSALTLPRRRAR